MERSNQIHLKFILLFIIINIFSNITNGEKILILTPLSTKSENSIFSPLASSLNERKHDVTIVTTVRSDILPSSIRQLVPIKAEVLWGNLTNPIDIRLNMGIKDKMFLDFTFLHNGCHVVYQDSEFQKLINEKYDLVIMGGIGYNCFTGILPKIGSPYIFLISTGPVNFVSLRTGSYLPPSFVPSIFVPLTHKMGFFERILNFIVNTISTLDHFYRNSPEFERIYKHYLGKDLPKIEQIEQNASLLLTNSDFVTSYPKPLLPDIVEIGGIHCRPAQKLPQDIENFANGAKDGLIYFSLGSIIKGSDMGEKIQRVFLNVFSKLKQRVIWKFESENIKNLPKNIILRKWLPQQDILGLGHPLKLFITHGGLLSKQESLYHGVPLISIPITFDQDYNANSGQDAGVSLTIDLTQLTEEILEESIHKILNDPSYKRKAEEKSAIFKDQIQKPMDRAIYWIEYVIRHKGAKHLQSSARDLNFFQYHSLDIIFAILIFCIILIYSIKILIKKLWKKLFYSKDFKEKLQ